MHLNYSLFLLTSLIWTACPAPKKTLTPEKDPVKTEKIEEKPTEKLVLGEDKKMTISGQVIVTEDYCGGAAPPDELVENLRKPHPYANAELFIRSTAKVKGSTTIGKIRTSENGKFSIDLPVGKYAVVTNSKLSILGLSLTNPEAKMSSCTEWLEKPDFILEVATDAKNVNIYKFHVSCNPCLPPPPMSAPPRQTD